MNSVNFKSLGCKVNFFDTQEVVARFTGATGAPVEVIGTCCVTREAEKQSRKEVRRAIKRAGPQGQVLVTGCAARLAPGSFDSLGVNVTLSVNSVLKEEPAAEGNLPGDFPAKPQRIVMSNNSRARFFLKIQDGCANFCSYCVVPLVRGRPRSLSLSGVLKQARAAVDTGCQEVVVCGINVGSWRDGKQRLPELLDELARIDGLARLRLSSIEAVHLNQALLRTMSASSVICPHLHVPLQSGDDGILKAMGRRYDRAGFSGRLAAARQAMPGINLTTDVIVGFPGENERAFRNTLDFVTDERFSKVHVFPFSPRPGTRAARLHDPVPAAEKGRRTRLLLDLSRRLGRRHRQRKVGCLSEVLLESAVTPGIYGGYSADYTRFLVGQAAATGMASVRAEAVRGETVLGNIIN